MLPREMRSPRPNVPKPKLLFSTSAKTTGIAVMKTDMIEHPMF